MFDFMPSSVEVIEPAKVVMNMSESTDLLNNISGRMHRYDEIAKVLGERYRQLGVQFQTLQKVLAERDAEILEPKKKSKKKAVKKKTKKK